METDGSKTKSAIRCQRFLQAVALIDLCAGIVPCLPGVAVEAVAGHLLGTSESASPVAVYLAKITATLYAAHGLWLWGLASDAVRYAPLIRWVGMISIAQGAVLLAIDLSLGMPWWWTGAEGPIFALIGFAMTRLARDIDRR